MSEERHAGFDFLSLEDIYAIHADQLEVYGGAEGIIDKNVIHSACNNPQWLAFYGTDDGAADVADFAAAYLYRFATTQGFVDGNKRTALAAAIEFLARNGYEVIADNTDVYDLTCRVANKLLDQESVAEWFRARLIPNS